MRLEIRGAESPSDIDALSALLTEYTKCLQEEMCLQVSAEETARRPGKYAPPEGGFLIAASNGEPAGCIALRKFGEGVAEAKRLWVRSQFRKHGVGVALLKRMVAGTKAKGYRRVV